MPEITCRHAQAVDMKRVKEIILLSFPDAAEHPAVVDDLENETWYSWENWGLAESDGEVVSALGLRPGVMWVRGVAVPTATLGTVCTHPDLRGRGIGRELLAFADDVMKEEGVVLSRLHTLAVRYAFYGRSGYVKTVTTQPTLQLEVEAVRAKVKKRAEAELGDAVVRPAHERDAARMNEIYEATFSHGTGALSRNEHFFRRRIAHKSKLWFWYAPKFVVAEDPKEGVIGYIAFSLDGANNYGVAVELAALLHHAPIARTILLHVVRQAQDASIKRLDVSIDAQHPLGWIVHEFPISGEPDSFVMFLKVQNEKRFVELMRPVVEKRAERFEVKLTMNLAGMPDIILGEGQEVKIVSDVRHFAALIYNGAWLAGLMGQAALRIEPETIAAHRAVQEVFIDTHARRCELDGY